MSDMHIENIAVTYIACKRNSNEKHHQPSKDIYKSSPFRELIREYIYQGTSHSFKHSELK